MRAKQTTMTAISVLVTPGVQTLELAVVGGQANSPCLGMKTARTTWHARPDTTNTGPSLDCNIWVISVIGIQHGEAGLVRIPWIDCTRIGHLSATFRGDRDRKARTVDSRQLVGCHSPFLLSPAETPLLDVASCRNG